MKIQQEYVILLLLYIFVLTILYSYKIQTEGFGATSDFVTSNIALVVGFGTIILTIVVYLLYTYFFT